MDIIMTLFVFLIMVLVISAMGVITLAVISTITDIEEENG